MKVSKAISGQSLFKMNGYNSHVFLEFFKGEQLSRFPVCFCGQINPSEMESALNPIVLAFLRAIGLLAAGAGKSFL